jgi:hypothetical protein
MKFNFNKRADNRRPGFEPAKPGPKSDTSFIRDRPENGYKVGKGNGQQQSNVEEAMEDE